MEIDWGSLIGGLGGAFVAGILLVLGGSSAWRRTKNWDRQRDRELAFKRWAHLFQGAIEAFCEAFCEYESWKKSRAVLTELCFNFLHIHNLADTGSHEGYQDEIAEVDSDRKDDFNILRRSADNALHQIELRRYGRMVPLDSIKHSEREYTIAEDGAVLRGVAEQIASATRGERETWEKFARWLGREKDKKRCSWPFMSWRWKAEGVR
jgi:hypothetical protein